MKNNNTIKSASNQKATRAKQTTLQTETKTTKKILRSKDNTDVDLQHAAIEEITKRRQATRDKD